MRIVGRGQMPVDTGARARERPDPIPPKGLQVVDIVVIGGLRCEFILQALHQ